MADAGSKKRILLLVEGERTDVKLMEHLFSVYCLDADYDIITYKTNIYVLYNDMFFEKDPDSMDLIQVLKSREQNPIMRKKLDAQYTDILLIFDLDPQDEAFSDEKILSMTQYFSESSDMGKLYINYPMVEAFYHMKSIPDPDFHTYTTTMAELLAHGYKKRVNNENRNHNYAKFAIDREECNIVIVQNQSKAWLLVNGDFSDNKNNGAELIGEDILRKQLELIANRGIIAILCTCVFFIPDYNPKFIE